MTIKIGEETALSMVEAAELSNVARETVWRWVTRGAGGVKLRAGRLGRRWYTSREAIQEFHDDLTAQSIAPDAPPARKERAKRARKADPDRARRVAEWRER